MPPPATIADPAVLRAAIRAAAWTGPTAGQAPGYAQANLVMVPAAVAADFRAFCAANPQPCPLLEVGAPGDPMSRLFAPGADLRTDLPRYRVYRDGDLVAEPTDICALWRADLVAFLIGCSFTFERALLDAGVPVRHIECGLNVPMYRTNRVCVTVGPFVGPLVVSMRPMPAALVPRATAVTARYPRMHGAPVHSGDPGVLGIADLAQPDYGDAVPSGPGEVPVFWACGVTPQAVAQAARLPFMITHAPGCMLVGDQTDAALLAAAG